MIGKAVVWGMGLGMGVGAFDLLYRGTSLLSCLISRMVLRRLGLTVLHATSFCPLLLCRLVLPSRCLERKHIIFNLGYLER